jgi:L-fuconate dehydratase
MPIKITNVLVRDIRFPTSLTLDGSDAVNVDPDYSATYVILETDDSRDLRGYGLTFTNGRGNEVCVAAVHALKHHLLDRSLESITEDFSGFWSRVTGDSQVRWLGPEKGVIHLAAGALINAVWDLYARSEGKPLWKLLTDMTPEQIVSVIPFHHITDALSRPEAMEILQRNQATKPAREQEMRASGYPAYTTSAGWLQGSHSGSIPGLRACEESALWTTPILRSAALSLMPGV